MAMIDSGEKLARRVFHADLMRVASNLRQRGVQIISSGPTQALESYYTETATKVMSKADFERGGCRSLDDIENCLRELWRDEGMDGIPERIALLARRLKRTDEQSTELSQFIYVMY